MRLSSGAVTPRLLGNRAGSVVDSSGYYRGIGDDFTVDRYDPVPSEAPISWTVFGPQSRWLGEVEIDRRFRPMEIGFDHVLGVWTSDLGVASVRRYGLEKPGPP